MKTYSAGDRVRLTIGDGTTCTATVLKVRRRGRGHKIQYLVRADRVIFRCGCGECVDHKTVATADELAPLEASDLN